MDDLEYLDVLLRHKMNVLNNGIFLGKKFIKNGQVELGKELIANVMKHDNSKFFGIEWDNFKEPPSKTSLAFTVGFHNKHNKHHPEYWGDIKRMPKVYLAEMMCDFKARSSEFGTSLLDYIEGKAMKRFKFTKKDDVYKVLMEFYELLCDKSFEQL